MSFKSVSLSLLLVLLVSSLIVGGCTLKAAPDPEGLPGVASEDEMMQQYAEENTQAMTATPGSEEPTPVEGEPTAEAMAEATATPVPDVPPAETVALPIATPTPEPTSEEVVAVTTPTATPLVTRQPTPTGPRTHVVQAGENLFRIALRYGMSVETLAQVNGITNPSLIYVGQQLKIPGTSTEPPSPPAPGGGGTVHIVKPGENLFRIALKYNYNHRYLAQYNGISNPNFLSVGQKIIIP